MKLHSLYTRIIVALGLMSFVLLLSACGQTQEVTPSQLPVPTKVTHGQGSTNAKGSAPSSGQANGQASTSTIVYKSVVITIVSVDQQKQFAGDDESTGPIVVRINLHEQNPTEQVVYVSYDQSMRLILPDGSTLEPKTNASAAIERAIVRDSWLDFSVNSQQDLSKLILRIGTTDEHQMDVPLKQNPDLAKYQARSTTLNTKLNYGVNWTVTKATSSLSADGEQAAAGKRYIIVTLQADNSTGDIFYPSPSDNFRLKSNTVVQEPKSSTLPSSIAAHSTGNVGTVTFLVPENGTDLQLQLLAQPKEGINAAYANFQL